MLLFFGWYDAIVQRHQQQQKSTFNMYMQRFSMCLELKIVDMTYLISVHCFFFKFIGLDLHGNFPGVTAMPTRIFEVE
jgi:hypothetical protein